MNGWSGCPVGQMEETSSVGLILGFVLLPMMIWNSFCMYVSGLMSCGQMLGSNELIDGDGDGLVVLVDVLLAVAVVVFLFEVDAFLSSRLD